MVPTFWFWTESGNVQPVTAAASSQTGTTLSTNSQQGPHEGRRQRVCVVGAGCSGLVSVKALREVGHEAHAFELGSKVGGLWVYDNDSGRSAAYDSLCINTSRSEMQFPDYPMPSEYGDYATHRQVAEYFRAYAAHFDLERAVRFRTEVSSAKPTASGYAVVSRNLDTGISKVEHFDALVVASGHHFAPLFPDPPALGAFDGMSLHSHAYRNPDRPLSLRGQRVVVVGFGNSAVDIASELAQASGPGRVTLSTRRGAWVLPRYLLGRPIDQGRLLPSWLPARLRRRIATWAFRKIRGSMSDFRLPEPDHLIGEAHPTLSDELPALVRSGAIQMRPSIRRLSGKKVEFDDGSEMEVDAIVYCTGYRVSFPFLPADHVSAPDNDLPLFRRVFHPTHRRLFFVGLAQPLGAIMPIADQQARWIADHLAGNYNLPPHAELADDVASERASLKARYVTSRRHTMQIDPSEYSSGVEAEWRRGRRRASRRLGQAFPDDHGERALAI
jgi:dimethylaniline monooxygenase (N-oxide forming)